MIGARLLLALAAASQLAALGAAGPVDEEARRTETAAAAAAAPSHHLEPASQRRRPIFFSEQKLRAVVESTNGELRQLKRDFMKQMTDVYLRLKLDPELGYERARDLAGQAASANVLLAEEFASMAIKKHVVQRRLLTGLKLAFVKFLPMQTLVNLYRRYPSFAWLRDQEQVELRPKFPGAKESHFVILYTLIELRARVRAADDVLALTSDHIRRVLQVVQWYLVESRHGREVSGPELGGLARNAKVVMQYYDGEVLEWRARLQAAYEAFWANAGPLAKLLGGERQLVDFLDRLIDVEALDIELSEPAQQLQRPPTIDAQMVANVQQRWIPWYVLRSLEEDRRLLVANRRRVLHLVRLEPARQQAEVSEWLANLLDYVCHNEVQFYGRK